ncbi:uncharacterized protein LAJ45_08963 [Morchella importuna]|uniref:uncharacterized protein n=1 Tax=Morchella importuna TaxID=1174673 RepID=UPI001E8D5A24|nr:uncharacterized protein LAJ45_08963 [Morchella importuna]KAH8146884.1 hypothetical protein LAJ45_08963 [Morchella importuna]
MRLLALFSLALVFIMAHLTMANPAPAPAPAPAPVSAPDLDNPLVKRACVVNGCKCRPGVKDGEYCWGCNAHSDAGTWFPGSASYKTWVFQCGPHNVCCVANSLASCTNATPSPCGPV